MEGKDKSPPHSLLSKNAKHFGIKVLNHPPTPYIYTTDFKSSPHDSLLHWDPHQSPNDLSPRVTILNERDSEKENHNHGRETESPSPFRILPGGSSSESVTDSVSQSRSERQKRWLRARFGKQLVR
ncbi:hypothetical protein PIB30_059860 [Stylosanthes scabra]|uniref:Uncharacterized protein n=1 Tax=Stylosanthes scabra TaxID=79078 RepID=A0ABU6QK33_9FABA|nr:hypothetical protein [Stylosanthes scabra]